MAILFRSLVPLVVNDFQVLSELRFIWHIYIKESAPLKVRRLLRATKNSHVLHHGVTEHHRVYDV